MESEFFFRSTQEHKTKKRILLALSILSVAAIIGTIGYMSTQSRSPKNSLQLEAQFQSFMDTHQKVYQTAEEYQKRLEIYKQNVEYINQVNSQNLSYTLGENQFTDLTQDEFKQRFLSGLKASERVMIHENLQTSVKDLPEFVDWRQEGAVTPVKDQYSCGSCWSFSATGALEAAYFLKHGTLQSFSEQQLVDCSGAYGNEGCSGGLMDNAFNYYRHHTAELESEYSYEGYKESCKYNKSQGFTYVNSYIDVQSNELALQEAVALTAVSVAVDASNWALYKGGIFDNCGEDLDHGVLAVGYGSENGKDYWIVKNSWGKLWGEEGYIRVARNNGGKGACGIASMASYPVLD